MSFIIHLSKVNRFTTRVNYNVNYGLWMIMIYQCKLIDCNKCTLVGDDDNREGYACIGAVNIWEISETAPQFQCEPKLLEKIN